jgi:outer membrane protein
VTAAPADSAPAPPLALGDAELKRLAEDAPVVREARSALDAAHNARLSAWTDYLPSLTTSYSRGGNAIGPTAFPDGADWSYSGTLRFSLSLPVFDQLQREERVVNARVAEDNAAAQLSDARLAALQTLATSLGSLRESEARVAAQTATVDAAGEDLRVQQERYALGSSTIVDLLTSQTQLDDARRDLIRARYDQRVARAQIEALLGRDL